MFRILIKSRVVLLLLLVSAGSAHALDERSKHERFKFEFYNLQVEKQAQPRVIPQSLRAPYRPHHYAQKKPARVKSRAQVMNEVKRRYDAQVLKIRLNGAREMYVVRILMPNGKVKTIQVSARG